MTAASPTLPTSAAWPLAERFARFIAGLREAMGSQAEHNAALMNIVARLWNRLTEAAERFTAIAAKPVVPPRRPAPPAARPAPAGSDPHPDPHPEWAAPHLPPAPRRLLPTGHGWLVRMSPQAVPFGIEFAYLLAQPEMTELLAAAPRLWRVLRPLCRMFGITPPHAPPPSARTAEGVADIARQRRRRQRAERQARHAAVRRHGPQGSRPALFRC
ncbi:MAG: hypothetical protein KGL52_00990 [Rhodospirillales bacterium]|nr:hypothetical protein [Rhodospirillales bacterium]